MGFRKDAYATVWSTEPVSDVQTKARISISRKDRQTGEYVTDFSGFVSFFGTAAAKRAAGLKERDRIKLGDVDVSNRYDKEKNQTFTNYKVFSFELADGSSVQNTTQATARQVQVDDGELDDSEDLLPF